MVVHRGVAKASGDASVRREKLQHVCGARGLPQHEGVVLTTQETRIGFASVFSLADAGLPEAHGARCPFSAQQHRPAGLAQHVRHGDQESRTLLSVDEPVIE